MQRNASKQDSDEKQNSQQRVIEILYWKTRVSVNTTEYKLQKGRILNFFLL
jgi:hypothetical protein